MDLRLAPAALAVWAATLVGLLLGWPAGALVAVAALGGALAVWRLSGTRSWARGTLAVLILAGLAAAGIAARIHAIEHHPLRTVAAHGEQATVHIRLGESPRPLSGASFGARRAQDRAAVRAELISFVGAGQRIHAGGKVLMLVQTDQWRGLVLGQELTARGKVIEPRHGELTVAAVQAAGPPSEVGPAPGWQRVAEGMREGLRHTSAAVLSPAAAGLLPGLVFGDTRGLPPEVEQEFTIAGLTHLTAVSGANLAIVCGAVLGLLRVIGVGPMLSAAGAVLALIGFVVLAGPEPSVLRAAVMGAVTLLALVLGREKSVLPALAAAVIGLLLLAPDLAVTIGFALSVAATAALVLLAPVWCGVLHANGVPIGIAEAIGVPAAAHVVTAPLVAAISGEVSMVAVAANVLAAPVVAPATVFGVLATVFAPVSVWAAKAFVWLCLPELEWVLWVADRSAAIPGATVRWPYGTTGGLLLAGLTAMALILLRSNKFRWLLIVSLLVAGLVLVPVRTLDPGWPVRGWSVVACDVGQGDGLVLATGRPAEAVVVDTGPEPLRASNCLRRLGIRRVPLLVLTHLHADHVSGLPATLVHRGVGGVAVGPLRKPEWANREITRDTRAHGVPIIALVAGQQARWPALTLDVLAPKGVLARVNSAGDANDASIVLRATTPAGRILLTGDIELQGQAELLASGTDLRADVLKVPHHGSRYTTPRFLRAVHPKLALISVGDGNSYGHPSPMILSALTREGTRIARTDKEGDIAVVSSPQGPQAIGRGDPVRATDRR